MGVWRPSRNSSGKNALHTDIVFDKFHVSGPFSVSTPFSCLASDTLMPPNLLRHR